MALSENSFNLPTILRCLFHQNPLFTFTFFSTNNRFCIFAYRKVNFDLFLLVKKVNRPILQEISKIQITLK